MPQGSTSHAIQRPEKRKIGPIDAKQPPSKRYRAVRDARTIRAQPVDAAYNNGELDVAKFVQAREFEIRALEESMRKGRSSLSSRAFQQVPREMRRRTASHNVAKVPKRLRRRAAKEMAEDNTPTVNAKSRRRKASSKLRLRLDTAKRLQLLTQKAGSRKAMRSRQHLAVSVMKDGEQPGVAQAKATPTGIKIRAPRIKKYTLQNPAKPPAKFAKRQRSKTWLPTHLYHTKRAHMTAAGSPLWRWALPLTPTMKGYRATHRASTEKGVMAWDMSYMATVGLEGRVQSIVSLLKALGVGLGNGNAETWGNRGKKWRSGKRAWHGWLYSRQRYPEDAIAPVTLIWCPEARASEADLPISSSQHYSAPQDVSGGKTKRKTLLQVHPSAFKQVWDEVIRLAKVQKPGVTVEDLRFEIASLQVNGPQALETLVGALHEYDTLSSAATKRAVEHASAWQHLASCNNPANLAKSFVIPLEVVDPRLHFPPRKTRDQPPSGAAQQRLLQLAADWPWDERPPPTATIFDRPARLTASRLPTQKSIDRRRRDAQPNQTIGLAATDPRIPALVYSTPYPRSGISPLTILLPWKCAVPVWRAIMYHPLSTGSQAALGCLTQQRQLCLESGAPWFPGDYPGTKAGDEWGIAEEESQRFVWESKPRGKRVSFDTVDLGNAHRGELGKGWCCDWEYLRLIHGLDSLVHIPTSLAQSTIASWTEAMRNGQPTKQEHRSSATQRRREDGRLVTVRLRFLSKGLPKTNARIYSLPASSANATLRKSWLALRPTRPRQKAKASPLVTAFAPSIPLNASPHLQNQRLATSLLASNGASGEESPRVPPVPDNQALIGFVTSGNFNLACGLGTAVGSILLGRALHDDELQQIEERTLCIVRNAGESVGRLAQWELAG